LEILYERVDESPVVQLSFATPGHRPDDQPMRYPYAGTPNAITSLRMVRMLEDVGDFMEGAEIQVTVDLELKVDLKQIVPWYEYIARCDWTGDGEK